VRLKGYAACLLARALVVIDELAVERDTDPRSVGLDEEVVPGPDLDDGRSRRRLQIVDRTRDFQQMTFCVSDRVIASLIDLNFTSEGIRFLKRVLHIGRFCRGKESGSSKGDMRRMAYETNE